MLSPGPSPFTAGGGWGVEGRAWKGCLRPPEPTRQILQAFAAIPGLMLPSSACQGECHSGRLRLQLGDTEAPFQGGRTPWPSFSLPSLLEAERKLGLANCLPGSQVCMHLGSDLFQGTFPQSLSPSPSLLGMGHRLPRWVPLPPGTGGGHCSMWPPHQEEPDPQPLFGYPQRISHALGSYAETSRLGCS